MKHRGGKSWMFLPAGALILGASLGSIFAEQWRSAEAEVAGQQVEVLDSQEMDYGERSLILNRVRTPVLKAPLPVEEVSAKKQVQPSLTPELNARAEKFALKEYVAPFWDIRVMDNGVSEIRWHDENGEFVIWSSMDARVFRALHWFETEDFHFMIFGSVAEETVEDVLRWNAEIDRYNGPQEAKRSIPTLGPVRTEPPRYLVIKEPAPSAAAAVMDAMHGYYDANRAALIQNYEAVEAARLAREKELRENPPVPQDTVIHYFPIRSNANLGGNR